MRLQILIVACLLAIAGAAVMVTADDSTPSSVAGYAMLGFVVPSLDPTHDYEDPNAVLGRPTTVFRAAAGPGYPGGDFHLSLVVGACNRDLDGDPVVTSIQPGGGYITVAFDTPIEDDPGNWFGKDFIVFGNSFFSSIGFVTPTTNMETQKLNNGIVGTWEPSVVSVSQDGVTWYDYTNGPYGDDFAPTQAYTWDRDTHNWDTELDWTKPVDPSLTKSSFANKTVADAIDMYNGSAGGTAFDLSGLPLPLNENGRKWIRYVKIIGTGGEVDAVSRVSHVPTPISMAAARLLPDNARVRLCEGIVTASRAELGNCLYIQAANRASGIRVTGRSIALGKRVIVSGVMATENGERKLKATAVEDCGSGSVEPLAVTGREFNQGPGVSGLLVKMSGRAGPIDTPGKSFILTDGSGVEVKCRYPSDSGFSLPADGDKLVVAGIASCEVVSQQTIPVLRMWTQAVAYQTNEEIEEEKDEGICCYPGALDAGADAGHGSALDRGRYRDFRDGRNRKQCFVSRARLWLSVLRIQVPVEHTR